MGREECRPLEEPARALLEFSERKALERGSRDQENNEK
jgi:hypothetical protein